MHARFAIAAIKSVSSGWQQVIGARIDAKLVKPGCVSPSKRGGGDTRLQLLSLKKSRSLLLLRIRAEWARFDDSGG